MATGEDEPLISMTEAAELLGIPLRTAQMMARQGRLPVALKMPGLTGAYLFRRSDIEAAA